MGTTIEEEKELKKQTASSSDKVIGEWLDESPYVGAKYTLLKKGNQIIMIRKFKDKSGSEKEMTQKKHGGLLRFEEKGGNSNGEYYLIEKNGHLCSYDSEGLIKSIKSIK